MIKHLSTPREAALWLHSKVRGSLCADSRAVHDGDGFVAWPGYAVDGRSFVQSAIDKGAAACLVEHAGLDGIEQLGWQESKVASLAGLKELGGCVADAYFESPSAYVKVLAVTGTNGKTSVAWWLSAALSKLERRCTVIGTLGVGEVNTNKGALSTQELLSTFQSTGLTTPDPITLQRSLKICRDSQIEYCALEASSIGIAEHRMGAVNVHTAIFTNLSRDHLDYHADMQAYFEAKAKLFEQSGLRCAVINVDDPRGEELAHRLSERVAQSQHSGQGTGELRIIRVSEHARGDLNAEQIDYPTEQGGLSFVMRLVGDGAQTQTAVIETALVGRYNVSNLLCVAAALLSLGFNLEEVASACTALPAVAGRMQRVRPSRANVQSTGPVVVVDYAHTPDALEQALKSLKPLVREGAQLHCVIGCGGNRDSGKRPEMARVATRNATRVTLTADNPRGEVVQSILDDMLRGVERANSGVDAALRIQPERALAIAQSIAEADAFDVILLAGKGHENTQEIEGVKYPFSDVEHAQRALDMWCEKGRVWQ